MIGYYVHHVGSGHLARAQALARVLAERQGSPVTGLSTLPRPDGWPGEWVRLDRDDTDADPHDPTARGRLHWVPVHDDGLRRRMARLSAWLDEVRPDAVVSDVSVEVTLLARLHGVPVASVVLPGDRGDAAHRHGYAVSDLLLAAWPATERRMVRGLSPADRERLVPVGALSRFPVASVTPASEGRRVLVLSGRGGGHPTTEQVEAARAATPGWHWDVLGGDGGWEDDPSRAVDDAAVVVVQAGESAVADVAARRRPAVVVPAHRPFDEQWTTARTLAAGAWPCRVRSSFPRAEWPELLAEVAGLDGGRWSGWCDGAAAERFADRLEALGARREVAS